MEKKTLDEQEWPGRDREKKNNTGRQKYYEVNIPL